MAALRVDLLRSHTLTVLLAVLPREPIQTREQEANSWTSRSHIPRRISNRKRPAVLPSFAQFLRLPHDSHARLSAAYELKLTTWPRLRFWRPRGAGGMPRALPGARRLVWVKARTCNAVWMPSPGAGSKFALISRYGRVSCRVCSSWRFQRGRGVNSGVPRHPLCPTLKLSSPSLRSLRHLFFCFAFPDAKIFVVAGKALSYWMLLACTWMMRGQSGWACMWCAACVYAALRSLSYPPGRSGSSTVPGPCSYCWPVPLFASPARSRSWPAAPT